MKPIDREEFFGTVIKKSIFYFSLRMLKSFVRFSFESFSYSNSNVNDSTSAFPIESSFVQNSSNYCCEVLEILKMYCPFFLDGLPNFERGSCCDFVIT